MRKTTDTDKLNEKSQERPEINMRSNHGVTVPADIPEGCFWLGQVGRPHGVRGAFFLKTEDNRVEWPGYKTLFLRAGQRIVSICVEKSYVSGGKLALQLEGILTRERAEELYNSHLFVARSEIRLEESEYLVGELVGCQVYVEGRDGIFGEVVAVHDFGAQETLEIARAGNRTDTVLYPFVDTFVVEVLETGKKIVIKDEPAFLDDQNS